MNSGAGGDVLQGKIESGLMEQLEDVVQDAEDEAEFRNEHMIAGEDPEEDKIDDVDIDTDENGVYKIFKNISSSGVKDENDEEELLDEAFK